MRLTLSVQDESPSVLYRRRLDEVTIESTVHSKRQARAEFERFLNATDLPDQTTQERQAAQFALTGAEERIRQQGESIARTSEQIDRLEHEQTQLRKDVDDA